MQHDGVIPNEKITDFTPYQMYVSLWEVENRKQAELKKKWEAEQVEKRL
jgi:hypothetical protein